MRIHHLLIQRHYLDNCGLNTKIIRTLDISSTIWNIVDFITSYYEWYNLLTLYLAAYFRLHYIPFYLHWNDFLKCPVLFLTYQILYGFALPGKLFKLVNLSYLQLIKVKKKNDKSTKGVWWLTFHVKSFSQSIVIISWKLPHYLIYMWNNFGF